MHRRGQEGLSGCVGTVSADDAGKGGESRGRGARTGVQPTIRATYRGPTPQTVIEVMDLSDEHGACWRCRYFVHDEEAKYCRRFPPVIIDIGSSAFVSVDWMDWCGEFEEG